MRIDSKRYREYAEKRAPRSPIVKNCALAFLTGGGICALSQLLRIVYSEFTVREDAALLASVTLIFLAALLTGLGVYDKIAKKAGAGTLVPITGFANALASAAVDCKSEGFILGVGAKIFTVAGPVILYGISAGAIYGIIYWITTLF